MLLRNVYHKVSDLHKKKILYTFWLFLIIMAVCTNILSLFEKNL